jgi:hypothetical protein
MRRGSSAASSSPLALLDVGGEKAVEMYGTANPILVAFQPATGDNNWMTPPTWVVTGDPLFLDDPGVAARRAPGRVRRSPEARGNARGIAARHMASISP